MLLYRENTITELQTLILDLLSERAQMLLQEPNFEVGRHCSSHVTSLATA